MPLALILHGTPDKKEYFDSNVPSPSNCHWLPWLQKQLILSGFEAQTPEMPIAYKPDYRLWSATISQFNIQSDSILVGHSCGGGFLLRWLCENKITIRRLILVAPWMDPDCNHCVPGFFDFDFDPELAQRTEIHIIYSNNDDQEVNSSVQTICQAYPQIHQHPMPGRGHFIGVLEFPELRELVLQGC